MHEMYSIMYVICTRYNVGYNVRYNEQNSLRVPGAQNITEPPKLLPGAQTITVPGALPYVLPTVPAIIRYQVSKIIIFKV